MKLEFDVLQPSELSAGIRGFTDEVTVSVKSGDPGGEPGEFEAAFRDFLCEWYDLSPQYIRRKVEGVER